MTHASLSLTKGPSELLFIPKIYTKFRKDWKGYVNFQLSGKTVPFLAVLCTERFCNFAKASYFSGCFFHVYKKRVSAHCRVHTKDLTRKEQFTMKIWLSVLKFFTFYSFASGYSYLSHKSTCLLILFKKKVQPTLWFNEIMMDSSAKSNPELVVPLL